MGYNSYISYPALIWAEAAIGKTNSFQNPYQYAVACGYTGTEEQFRTAYMTALQEIIGVDGGTVPIN